MKWFAKLNSQLEWFFTDCPTPIQCAKSAKKQLHIPYQNAKYVISISKWHILQSLLCRLIIHSFLPQCHPSQNVISTTFHHRFVDYSLAFNTIVPATLVAKLQTLGQNRSLCSWILDFLTGRSQVVRMGNNTSSPLILNTGAPQGCVLSPLLYSLYTHDCTATHSSNVIVKFADDTTVIGLITDNDETAYREEVSTLTKWCQENHLSLNIDKTKELVVDYRRQSREHTPITINKTPVERVNSFKFLGVHITEDLTWSAHTDVVLKKAHQRLFFLRRLRKFGTSPSILRSFYSCTVESILTGCITAWFGNSTAGNRKALQRVVRTARHIVGGELPSLPDIYTRRCTRKAQRIIKDSSHPSHSLLSLLPSGRRFRSIRSRTSRLRDSFFPQAIRLMNSHK